MSIKNTGEELLMHWQSDNIEIMINGKSDQVIEELFESLLFRYQIGLDTTMKDSSFIFDYVNLLYYECHKINPNCSGSYIDSPDWIKNKSNKFSQLKWW